jgi:alpha-ribazole phosphatase
MKLILVRHGITDWNSAQRFQGQSDIPLNETGKKQAAALAKRLAGEPIDVIIASDLQRASETAQTIVAKHTCPLRLEPRLREINFGAWEGLTYDEIRQQAPLTLASWESDFQKVPPPGGETVSQLAVRVDLALKTLRGEYTDQTVLVVAHGGPLQTLVCLALGISPLNYWQFHLSTASISRLAFYPAGAIVNGLNDTCHLD